MGFGGIGIPELILLGAFAIFVWFSIKVARHSFGLLRKARESSPEHQSVSSKIEDFDVSDFHFVSDSPLLEKEIISSEEEIPLDNRHGTSPLVSEHEFTRTVTNSFVLNKTQQTSGGIKTSLWTLVETEVQKNLSQSINVQFGEQVSRRVTVKLEAGPGEFVRYKLVWKQKHREGLALITLRGKKFQIPYRSTFGLYHAVESMQT